MARSPLKDVATLARRIENDQWPPRARTVLAFDPGPKESGWAHAGRVGASRPRFLAGGKVKSDHASLRDFIVEHRKAWPNSVIAVELTGRYIHDRQRAAALLDTSGVSNAIEAIAFMLDAPYVALPVQTWRRRLCPGIRGTPGDDDVKQMLRIFCTNLPKRSNTHVRDALGLAVVVLLGIGPGAQPRPAGSLPPPYRPGKRRR